jgi:hypothetical protein
MLADWIYGHPIWMVGSIIIGSAVLLSCGGLVIFHALVPLEVRRAHNDIVGFTIAIVGVVYAVLLAFIAVATWETFAKADGIVGDEANRLGNLFFDTAGLPDNAAGEFRQRLKDYVQTVINDEWPAEQSGRISRGSYEKGWDILSEFNVLVATYRPGTAGESVVQAQLMQTLNELFSARRTRLLAAKAQVPEVVWWIIFLGGTVTVGYTYLFGMHSFKMHLVITATMAASLALVIVLIVALDRPFRGEVSVSSEAFVAVRHMMAADKFQRH